MSGCAWKVLNINYSKGRNINRTSDASIYGTYVFMVCNLGLSQDMPTSFRGHARPIMSKRTFPAFGSAPKREEPITDECNQMESISKRAFTPNSERAETRQSPFFTKDRKCDLDLFKYDYRLSRKELPMYHYSRNIMDEGNFKNVLGFPEDMLIEIGKDGAGFIVRARRRMMDIRYFDQSEDTEERENIFYSENELDYKQEFIPFDNDDHEQAVLMKKSSAFFPQRTMKQLASDSTSVDQWLQFIDDQDYLRVVKSVVRERKLAICEAALKHVPESDALTQRYLELLAESNYPEEMLHQAWNLAINKFKYNWDLRFLHIEHYMQRFVRFRVEEIVILYTNLIRDLHKSEMEEAGARLLVACSNLLAILVSSGYIYEGTVLLLKLLGSNDSESIGRQLIDRLENLQVSMDDQLLCELTIPLLDEHKSFIMTLIIDIPPLANCNQMRHLVARYLESVHISSGWIKTELFELPPICLTFTENAIYDYMERWIVKDCDVRPNLSMAYEGPLFPLKNVIDLLKQLTMIRPELSILLQPIIAQLLPDGASYLKDLLSKESHRFDLWYHLIMNWRWKGRDAEAEKALEKLLATNQVNIKDKLLLCKCQCEILTKQGRFDDAFCCIYGIMGMVVDPDRLRAPTILLKARRTLTILEGGEDLLSTLEALVKKETFKQQPAFMAGESSHELRCMRLSDRIKTCKQAKSTNNGGFLEYFHVLAANNVDDARLALLQLLTAAPYCKTLAIRALRHLRKNNLVTIDDMEAVCIVLEERGCKFYFM